ncbi:MAG TPA: LexA family transcriptional regulator [Flavobacterium sp.]|nr:LexA family transcriptional regulator [Flavobacterium sp.]
MSLLSDNLAFLRVKKGDTQEVAATGCKVPRPRYANYEYGIRTPPPEFLVDASRYFHISIDLMLSVDLRKVPLGDLLKLGDNRILLPITVDRNGDNFIEIIPHKAQAGYLTGYADPEYIENLQHISLPWLHNGKFRAFPVSGDSMPPHKEGSFIIGKFIERLGDVLDGKTYILLTKNEGIVYKRLNKNGKNELVLTSDNTFYQPYKIKASDILEIWQYECSIAREEFKPDDLNVNNITDMFLKLQSEIKNLKS